MTVPSNLTDWIEVAQAMSGLEAQVLATLLHAAQIPVYIETPPAMGIFMGELGSRRIYVPSKYYEVALDLLETDDEGEDTSHTLDEGDIVL